MKIRCFTLNGMVKTVMERLGKHIARRPYIFILFSVAVSIILGMGNLLSIYEPVSPEYLTINRGKYEENKKHEQSLFPMNSSKDFDPVRITNLPIGPIVFAVNKNGGGMINKSVFRDLQLLDEIIRNVSIETTEHRVVNFAYLCAIENGACFVNPLMKIVKKIDDILIGKYRFKYPVNVDERRFEVTPFVANIGGVVMDKKGYVENFMAVRLFYNGDDSNIDKRNYMEQWEKQVIQKIETLQFETIEVHAASVFTAAKDINEINKKLLPMSVLMVVVVALFCMIAFITNSWKRSKAWLGLAAVVSAGLAIIVAYGIMFYAGVKRTDLILLVSFVVLGTEIDDAFVMVASWRNTNSKESVEQRLSKTYSEAAVSVTLSSLTSFLAYCIGTITPISIVHDICFQCAICILFTYFYQILFFGPFMALDGYREKSERNCFTFCKTSSSNGKCDQVRDITSSEDDKEILMKCMQNALGGLLKFPICKAVCLILFAANLIFASCSILGLKKGSSFRDTLAPGSETDKTAAIQIGYFSEYQHTMHIMINKPLNYWDKNVQASIEKMLMNFENHPNIADSSLTLFWLKYYKMFAEHPLAKSSLLGGYDMTKKENFLDGLRRVFLRFKILRQFGHDINFNENYTEITSSRFIVICTNLTGIDDEIKLMQDVDEIVAKSEIPITVFSTLFIQAEQGSAIGKMTVQTMWITSLLMFAVFLLFIANFYHAILVAICVTSSMIGTVGFMVAWNVKLDIIALIVIVTCLGFSINYSAHMSYAFTTAQAGTTHGKVKESIYRVGIPVLYGSLSTIIAVSILMFQEIYIYIACFRVIFLTVLETAFHSLFVLPTLFSIFDSCANSKSNTEKKKEIEAPPIHIVESHHL